MSAWWPLILQQECSGQWVERKSAPQDISPARPRNAVFATTDKKKEKEREIKKGEKKNVRERGGRELKPLPLATSMLKGMLIFSVGSEKRSYLIQSYSFRVIAWLTVAQRSILSHCSLAAPTAVFCSSVASLLLHMWKIFTFSYENRPILYEAIVDNGTVVLGRWMFVF